MTAKPRDISAVLPAMAVEYVRRTLGDDGVARVAELLGGKIDERLLDPNAWCPLEDALRVAEAAARVSGEPDIGRRAGEEHFRYHRATGVTEFLVACGTVHAAIKATIAFSQKMAYGVLEVATEGEREAEMRLDCEEATAGQHVFCGFATGYLGSVPSLFGSTATSVHPSCQRRGDPEGRIVVRWSRPGTTDDDVEASRRRSVTAVAAFEDLQATAAELALAPDVAAVLDGVLNRVSLAVMAGRAVVEVRLPGEAAPRVHSVGLRPVEVQAVTAAARAGGEDIPGVGKVAVLDLPGYGWLAVVFPGIATIDGFDRRLLDAYAHHAWAALKAAEAADEIERRRAGAEALYRFARRLADLDATVVVEDEVLTAGLAFTGGADATVWHGELPAGTAGEGCPLPPPGSDRVVVYGGDEPGQPRRCAVVVREAPIPLVFAGAVGPGRATADVVAALEAMADMAAMACANRALLDTISYDATHDAVTGIGNRLLFQDRLARALSGPAAPDDRVAVLFLDLDGFKAVNDTLGHEAGDHVLSAVARRISGLLREGDVVARLGGDEFVILLHGVRDDGDADAVADRVLRAVNEPIAIPGESPVRVGVSIGRASGTVGETSWEELLKQADQAMYRVKSAGKRASAHAGR